MSNNIYSNVHRRKYNIKYKIISAPYNLLLRKPTGSEQVLCAGTMISIGVVETTEVPELKIL